MELALYEPGLGYYSGGATKLGGAGDFVTAPELTPLFARTVARQVAEVLMRTGGDILELGAGTGRLAADLLIALDSLDGMPEHYYIVEVSAELARRQRELLSTLPPSLGDRVRWVEHLPDTFTGLVIGNEVLDAIPVHVVSWSESGVLERGVTYSSGTFAWKDAAVPDTNLLQAVARLEVSPPYVSEVNLAAPALARTLAKSLTRGLLLFIDYGFGRAEYYHPQRKEGTLMCHYRHRAHGDPFLYPGLQDITAHVDFTSIAEASIDAGLSLIGYTTQSRFLTNLGITDLVASMDTSSAEYARTIAPLQKLLSPAEMGELFKVVALGRGIDLAFSGFSDGDLTRLL
jgi:SAM-dependent MidA family methyltransferase